MKAQEHALRMWNKHDQVKRSSGKTAFVHFSPKEKMVSIGYGASPTVMAGGAGEVIGVIAGNKSFLVLAFDDDFRGEELARYLGGDVKKLRPEEVLALEFVKDKNAPK